MIIEVILGYVKEYAHVRSKRLCPQKLETAHLHNCPHFGRKAVHLANEGVADVAAYDRRHPCLSKQVADLEVTGQTALAPEVIEPAEATRNKRRALQVGDTVRVRSLNINGEVVLLGKNEVMVAVGRLQMRAGYDDLEFKSRPEEQKTPEAVLSLHPSPGMELDIRGVRVEEGIDRLGRYIDSAFLARLPFVRIIHGKGTGRLREAVREELRQNRHVRAWEEGKDGEGGPGVTVAHLVEQ